MANLPSPSSHKKYWKSLGEYSAEPEFMAEHRRNAKNEFPVDYDRPTPDASSMSRRTFMGLLSASMAMTAAACRRPDYKIVPSVKAVEYMVPGLPNFYTSMYSEGNAALGLEVKTREGRPIKIEGNSTHPLGGGVSSAVMQSAVLALYDPDRMNEARHNTTSVPPQTAISLLANAVKEAGAKGKGVRVLIREHASPSFDALCKAVEAAIPQLRFVTLPAFLADGAANANKAMFGLDTEFVPDFSKADVIFALDSDFLGIEKYSVLHTHNFAKNRKPSVESPTMSKLIAAESRLSLTGMNADIRLKLAPDQYHNFLVSVFKAVAARSVNPEMEQLAMQLGGGASGADADNARKVATELLARGKQGFVTAGAHLPAAIHALAQCINHCLGAIGTDAVVDPRHELPFSAAKGPGLQALRAELAAGRVGVMVFADVNPFYNGDKEFQDLLGKADMAAALMQHENETAAQCPLYIPTTHFLEAWDDVLTYDGTLAIQQPMIAPLNESSRSLGDMLIELAKAMGGALDGTFAAMQTEFELEYDINTYVDFLRGRWEGEWWGSDEVLGDTFAKHWEAALRQGAYSPVGYRKEAVEPVFNAAGAQGILAGAAGIRKNDDYFCAVLPDYKVGDGTLANNGWLQELPDPVTKITWDNVAAMSSGTAQGLGVSDEDVITLSNANGSIDLPVLIQPGMLDGVIATTTGYGRTRGGLIQEGVGSNASRLLDAGQYSGYTSVSVTSTDRTHELASTQNHHTLYEADDEKWINEYDEDEYRQERPENQSEEEKRRMFRPKIRKRQTLVQETTLETMQQVKAGKADHLFHEQHVPGREKGQDRFTLPLNISTEFEYRGHRWGMTIDLSQCTGCNACVVACQAENNIPVIGKEQVRLGRELHWIRLDRYYSGDPENPEAVVQPMFCQHCESAPCENVCPVSATTHSPEGLNEMTYNRCVGTRYCLNNCPYKVRRYNFLDYHTLERTPVEMVFNPDVTMRMRGVMEKCTFCVQRINRAKNYAKDQGRARVKDGEVVAACQQACPAGAIVFGDTNDETSQVSQSRRDERGFLVLEDLNVRPQITYLAKVRNNSEASA